VLAGVLITGSSSGVAKAEPPASSPAPGPTPSTPTGPEGIPLEEGTPLAPISSAVTGQTVDSIQCNSDEQVVYHVHTHLAVYVEGALRPLPAGIGIVSPIAEQTTDGAFDAASRCYYWLHVHAQDGVIHIESPSQQSYTLGQFFDIWGQPLSTDQIGPVTGALTVFVNGEPYEGDPRAIPLGSHESIQVDVGTPQVPPAPVDWAAASL
ncbi:MAG: hypothetical protein ACRDYE_03290, partial [Acidimicrobiales bacterium]